MTQQQWSRLRPVSPQSAAVRKGTSRWISHGALEGSSPRGRGNDGAGASACVARAQAKGADDRHACIAATALAPMCTNDKRGCAVAGARWEQAENRGVTGPKWMAV